MKRIKEETYTEEEVALGTQRDIWFVKDILPEHYQVEESKKPQSIHCKSSIGIRMPAYKNGSGKMVTDEEDREHWGYIMNALEKEFGHRLQEVSHNTCFCHVDFTIFLKERKIHRTRRRLHRDNRR